jgi:hypothetical protein
LCSNHHAIHKNTKGSEAHKCIRTDVLRNKLIDLILAVSEYCTFHPNQKYTYVQPLKGVKYCIDCVIPPSDIEQILDISAIKKVQSSRKNDSIIQIKMTTHRVADLISQERKNQLFVEQNHHEIEEAIEKSFTTIQDLLNEKKRELLSELKTVCNKQEAAIESNLDRLVDLSRELKLLESTCMDLHQHFTILNTSAIHFMLRDRITHLALESPKETPSAVKSYQFKNELQSWIANIYSLELSSKPLT